MADEQGIEGRLALVDLLENQVSQAALTLSSAREPVKLAGRTALRLLETAPASLAAQSLVRELDNAVTELERMQRHLMDLFDQAGGAIRTALRS